MSTPDVVTVLVVDDHDLLRRGVITSLENFDDLKVVGEADNGERAVDLARELNPDVVLMDLLMPGIGGVEATSRLTAQCSSRVLALTSFVDNDVLTEVLDAGAVSYLLKNVDAQQLADAVRMTARGGSAFAPEATRVLSERTDSGDLEQLTTREQEVASLIAEGKSNSDIAHDLGLSIFTVKNHVSQVLSKLHVKSRTQAASLILRSDSST